MSKDKAVNVKKVVRQTVRTLAEGGAKSEEELKEWRKLYFGLDEQSRYHLTLELLGVAVGGREGIRGGVR